MQTTPVMEAIERSEGKPIVDVIMGLYRQHRSTAAVAQKLGITRASLWSWRRRLGISDAEVEAICRGYAEV